MGESNPIHVDTDMTPGFMGRALSQDSVSSAGYDSMPSLSPEFEAFLLQENTRAWFMDIPPSSALWDLPNNYFEQQPPGGGGSVESRSPKSLDQLPTESLSPVPGLPGDHRATAPEQAEYKKLKRRHQNRMAQKNYREKKERLISDLRADLAVARLEKDAAVKLNEKVVAELHQVHYKLLQLQLGAKHSRERDR